MAAIITNQFRILNSDNLVAGIASTTSGNYYVFVGLPNSNELDVNWDTSTPSPVDNFDQYNSFWDTIIALKKLNPSDISKVIRKITWSSGNTYDMYRHDYSASNSAPNSGATNLYESNYYVINSDYRVYICINNGSDPENPAGKPSIDEPTFIDLEPRSAGVSGDGYVWKYLYTIKPSELIKFESTNYIPVPLNWATNSDVASVRDNTLISGQIKTAVIKNRGGGYTPNTYNNVPIKGDGAGALCSVVVSADQKVSSITITNGGSGYTYGTVDLVSANVTNSSTDKDAEFDVIIPPPGGHGSNIYRELGANKVLIYSRFENDSIDPDFITGNQFARIGIVKDPTFYNSTTPLTKQKASALYALKLTGLTTSTTFTLDSEITQTIGIGSTSVGKVASWDNRTGVVKYWQERKLSISTQRDAYNNPISPKYGYEIHDFRAFPDTGGSITIYGGSNNLAIQTNFGTSNNPGISTEINNFTYYLGQTFINGVSSPEVQKYSGDILYVDNRPSVVRTSNQKEDIKIILQF
jgi:hypothetical protein